MASVVLFVAGLLPTLTLPTSAMRKMAAGEVLENSNVTSSVSSMLLQGSWMGNLVPKRRCTLRHLCIPVSRAPVASPKGMAQDMDMEPQGITALQLLNVIELQAIEEGRRQLRREIVDQLNVALSHRFTSRAGELQFFFDRKEYAPEIDYQSARSTPPTLKSIADQPFEAVYGDLEDPKWYIVELLAKMAIGKPDVWYNLLTGKPADSPHPEWIQTLWEHYSIDVGFVGLVYDQSSRIRRGGIGYFHNLLSQHGSTVDGVPLKDLGDAVFHISEINLAADRNSAMATVPVGATRYLATTVSAPPAAGNPRPQQQILPPLSDDVVRVVAVGDTHLFESRIQELPQGHILVHVGDISFEESRSQDGEAFRKNFRETHPIRKGWRVFGKRNTEERRAAALQDLIKWFHLARPAVGAALRWLKEKGKDFQHTLLVGGNHDYILSELDPEVAVEFLRLQYGITYLHTQNFAHVKSPIEVQVKNGSVIKVSVWGSGVSGMKSIGAGRAAVSGNNAFQVTPETVKATFDVEAITQQLKLHGEPDLMVMHAPPAGMFQAKKLAGEEALLELADAVKPRAYICGHSHNDDNIDTSKKMVLPERWEGGVAAFVPMLGKWNQFHGLPVVIDMRNSARAMMPDEAM